MNRPLLWLGMLFGVAMGLCSWQQVTFAAQGGGQVAGPETQLPPSWQPVDEKAARAQFEGWLASQSVDASLARKAWDDFSSSSPSGDGDDLLDRVAYALASVDGRTMALVNECTSTGSAPSRHAGDWLADSTIAPFQRNNLRLLLARRLIQEGYYDEALLQLEGVPAEATVAPAVYFFCQMAAHHQLVEADLARAALTRLLEHEAGLPRRYQQLARLIERDLAGLKDESLDHISRRMHDISRRLGQGGADAKVQMIEKGVVESLDKLIKKLEEAQKKQQQQCASSSGGNPSSQPMEDSRPAELKAPGRVAPRDIGDTSGWGDLPYRERAEAMEQVGREFPAHYRELIELYFRELANEGSEPRP